MWAAYEGGLGVRVCVGGGGGGGVREEYVGKKLFHKQTNFSCIIIMVKGANIFVTTSAKISQHEET